MSVWTHELDPHFVQNEERKQLEKLEQQITHEYNEIKADIEDNELRYNLTFTRPFSSYLIPKDPGHLNRERRLYLERLAHVPTVPDLIPLAQELENELNTCSATISDYTPDSLPLLLQGFYLKRLSALTYAKTLHCVRWKRFCRQQLDFIQVEQQFKERSTRILAEFNDALQRSQRLAAIRETLLFPSTNASAKNFNQPVVNDDYVAYVRYLVCHYRGQKYFDQLSELLRITHLKFRTRLSTDTQTLTINLQLPISPFEKTVGLSSIPMIDVEQKQTLDKLNVLFRYYSLPLDTSKIQTSGDEMELYANMIRYYRTIFLEQERDRPSIQYDSAKPKILTQARQSPSCQLIKKSSWLPFVTIKPELDAQRERDYRKYVKGGKNDELLATISRFIHVRNAEKAASVLKQYLLALKAKKSAALKQVLDSSTTTTGQATAMADIFWKNIFELTPVSSTNPNGDDEENNSDNEELQDSYEFQDTSARSTRYMKRDEFNYLETLQKLGLDDTSGHRRDSDTEGNDASESYGLQLSYITLRLLRIRTLRHRCLHEFNYFRSLQRTLTIYEQRLLMSSKGKEFHSVDQRFNHHIPHTYLFDTPHECTFDTLQFMQSGEHIENIEDFAQEVHLDHDGSIVHVQDSTGLYIVYDCALDDVNALEEEIISIGSYFIEKAALKHAKNNSNPDFLRKIDRFEILYHLWEYELNYLQCKRQLIDCFYEIYQHTLDEHERQLITQTIVDLMARRPRIDFRHDDYFTHSYSLEIRHLNQYLALIREYFHRHINDIRQVTENLFDSTDFGAYFPSTRSQSSPPVYLSVSKIHSYYLFEFLESLSSLTRLPYLIKDTFDELNEFEQIQRQSNLTLTERMLFELEYLDEILTTYKQLDQPGAMYLPNHQRDVFNSLFSDHPTMMGKLAYEILKQIDEARTTKKEQYDKYIKLNTNLIELITLRYRLIRSASDCELLTMIYKQQLDVMGIDHSHLFLRFVQFEFAQMRTIDHEFDFDTSYIPDGRLDKITGQQHLLFAVQELEEGSIGRFSFRQKDQWLTWIADGDDGISNLKVALRVQLMHNHFVHTAILQHRIAIVCITQQLQTVKVENKPEQTKSSSVGKRHTADAKQVDQSNSLLNNVLYENARRKLFRENYFVSIQFEKAPCRDQALNEFLRQRELKPMQYQQVREAEKLKRQLLNDFVDHVHQRNALILLRLQIIQSYLSLTYLVHQFPLTSRTHFMWAKASPPPLPTSSISSTIDPSESSTPSPILTNSQTSNGYQYRPKMILNEKGTDVVNLWYMPSFTEQLRIFKNANLDINEVEKRLKDLLRIVSSLNDLIHIVVGYAQLNSATTHAEQRFNDRTYDLSVFDQSGEFSSELHEIQRELDSSSSMSLSTVADLLETKRRLIIFQIYYSLSYPIPQYFLSTKNQAAFDLVRFRSAPILPRLVGDYERHKPIYSILPNPLLPVQHITRQLYPWTAHQSEFNINAQRLWWPKYHFIDPIHLSLIGLKPPELAQANAELLSIQVMLQNIDDIIRPRVATHNMHTILHRTAVSTGEHLFKYLRLELYLTECIRTEIVREAWSTTKLNVLAIDTIKRFNDAFASFRDEIRSPVLRQLSTTAGHGTYYNDFPLALLNGQLAPSVTDYEFKLALSMRTLVELEGKYMMNDTLKRLKRERTLVLSERLREENSLPTDLWKKQQFTQNVPILRPHILDDLASLLTQYEYKDEQSTFLNSTNHLEEPVEGDNSIQSQPSEIYSIRRSDLEFCLKEIGTRLMQREHDNFTHYSSHYENLLYNSQQMAFQRENEIKNLRSQLQDQQFSLELEAQLLTISAYFELITELIRLRSSNAHLQLDKQLRFDKELNQIRERFQSINEQLLNTNLLLRTRFEQYREQLYNSTVTIIKEIRTEIYNMARAKLTSDAKSIIDHQQSEQKKLIDSLQAELHQTQEQQSNETYERERQSRKDQVELERRIANLQYQLDHYQKRYVYKTTKQIEEIQSLKRANNYLRKRITTNETHYKRMFESESRSESKANMERDDDRQQAINQKQIIETRLRWMQEQKEQLVRKDQELEKKSNQFERENQQMRLIQTYVKRDLVQTKKKLEQERSLKVEAIQQVETLRTNLNEIEEELEQMALNDGANSFISGSAVPPPSRTMGSSRAITPYQILLSRNRPMTSVSAYHRDKQRFTNSRLRCLSSTPSKRVQTANVHIEKITPLTEELLTNLGASTSPATTSVKMLRIKSAKT